MKVMKMKERNEQAEPDFRLSNEEAEPAKPVGPSERRPSPRRPRRMGRMGRDLYDMSLQWAPDFEVRRLSDLFVKELEQEPSDFSSVLWHPSAGVDWSAFVFYSKGYLARKESYQDLTPATFHVMTNLAVYDDELMAILESEDRQCFNDGRSRLRIAEFEHVQLKDQDLWRRTSRHNYYGPARKDVFRERGSDGILAVMEMTCLETGYVERVPFLYLWVENHNGYEYLMRSGLFTVRHVKAVCEGLAFGFCRRPLLDTLCMTGLGAETLESVWARSGNGGQVGGAIKRLSRRTEREVKRREMPMCFSGELFRFGGREVTDGPSH